MPQPRHVIASPNPSVDDSKTPAVVGPAKPEAAKVQPARATTAAPLKATTRPKPKRRRARPRQN